MGCAQPGNEGAQPGTHKQPEQGAGMHAGSRPGARGKTGASSRAFHVAGPYDPWCDRLAHCWGNTGHKRQAFVEVLAAPTMAGSWINLCLSHT